MTVHDQAAPSTREEEVFDRIEAFRRRAPRLRESTITLAHGAALPDPTGLFNAGFGGGTRRAIDLKEGETVDVAAFVALMQAAAAFNTAKKKT